MRRVIARCTRTAALVGALAAATVCLTGVVAAPAWAEESFRPAEGARSAGERYEPPAGTDLSPRIVGGSRAPAYGFMTSLQSRFGSHFCGGSLVSSRYVVTAAHCVEGVDADDLRVRVGSANRTQGGSVALVDRIVVHPEFSYVADQVNDIALLRLDRAVDRAPVALASSPSPGTRARVLGWGQTCRLPGACGSPTRLRQLDTRIAENSDCSQFGQYDRSTDLCVANPGGDAGDCYGDSGGPLLVRRDGVFRLAGVVSRGSRVCGEDPSVSTDVAAYAGWIRSVT